MLLSDHLGIHVCYENAVDIERREMHNLHVLVKWPGSELTFLLNFYRISSNKRPGRLFQIWVLRGALNRGGALNKKLLGLTVCTCKLP